MDKQLTFSLISDELAKAKTSKKEFLEKIERIIPFDEWIEIIRPCYYKGEHGNKPYDLELMLRIYLLQNLYDLSDMKVMNEIIDSRAFSDFCGVDSPNQVPDGDTIGRFRNILVENGLQEKLFHQVIDILILIFNHSIDIIQSLPVMLLMVSLDNEKIVSHSLSTTF